MPDANAALFSSWESFYVIIGSSSAALTGLMFVVVSLVPSARTKGSQDTLDAFATPNVVHFCAAFLISAVLSAPWRAFPVPAALLGLVGAAGLAYGLIVTRRARRQRDYEPVFEDILWHMILPLIAYAAMIASAWALASGTTGALFAVAAATILLLFIGIHNAWDTVTYLAAKAFDAEHEPHRKRPTSGRHASHDK